MAKANVTRRHTEVNSQAIKDRASGGLWLRFGSIRAANELVLPFWHLGISGRASPSPLYVVESHLICPVGDCRWSWKISQLRTFPEFATRANYLFCVFFVLVFVVFFFNSRSQVDAPIFWYLNILISLTGDLNLNCILSAFPMLWTPSGEAARVETRGVVRFRRRGLLWLQGQNTPDSVLDHHMIVKISSLPFRM